MPVTTKQISTYSVSIISEGDPNQVYATITVFDNAGKGLGFLRFYAQGASMAQNEFRTDLGYPLVSFPASSFSATVDILRNEKPVYFTWYDYMPVRCFGGVETSREPIGESEAAIQRISKINM